MIKSHIRYSVLAFMAAAPGVWAAAPAGPLPFLRAKTCFQTNAPYDPRLAIAVDAVIVHRHGDDPKTLTDVIGSWKQHGYTVGRMFFADSDATNAYTQGKWDGTPHPEDVELDAEGKPVLCAGIRPYMVPTEGWVRHLEEMTAQSIDAGADAILPEEPLAHVHTGYEKSFQQLWAKRYGTPWEPEKASARSRFLTAQLKSELYAGLEARLADITEQKAGEAGRDVAFIMPIHGLYSNVASRLVAPLGTSLSIANNDGYIGQVWTGPVNWAMANYDSPEESFFASAYVLYDYFVELTAGTRKKLWLLSDPVEDDPNHSWAEFEQWYRHCVVAKLLFPEADAFEVMPWPDRIFLPGHSTGGKTPAPERYRVALLSAIQALQEVPAGGTWVPPGDAPTEGVGVAMADTAMWEKEEAPALQGTYGLLLPLVWQGVPASACLLERSGDGVYLSRFRVIVLSYESLKPADAKVHASLLGWVHRGGSLILLGAPESLEGDFWWKKEEHPSPLHHLAAQLGIDVGAEGQRGVGRGRVYRRLISPRRFGDPAVARTEYLPLVKEALEQASGEVLKTPGRLCLRRGPFVIAHATRTPLTLPGRLLDVLDADLPIREGVTLQPGESGLYRDVSEAFDETAGRDAGPAAARRQATARIRRPRALHTTHRLTGEAFASNTLRLTIRGPAETPAVARVFTGTRPPKEIVAHDPAGQPIAVDSQQQGTTLRIQFPNQPGGATVEMRW